MTTTSMTDEEILASYCAGDGSAFPLLYRRYASRGMRYANSLLQNVDDSEEAVQEAFYRLLNSINRGAVDSDRGGFGALFFRTVRNLSIDTLRKRGSRSHVPIDDLPELGRDGAMDGVGAAGLERRIRTLVDTLPANHGDALKLKVLGGLSYDEIGEILGCTRGQVRTWIYRARRRLEESLRREDLIQGKE